MTILLIWFKEGVWTELRILLKTNRKETETKKQKPSSSYSLMSFSMGAWKIGNVERNSGDGGMACEVSEECLGVFQ